MADTKISALTAITVLGPSDKMPVASGGVSYALVGNALLAHHVRVTPTYGTTVTIDCSLGNLFSITVTNSTAFTISQPSNSVGFQQIWIGVFNNSGGAMGAITWGAFYTFAGITWVNPANTKHRLMGFLWENNAWVATSFTTADY